MHLGSDVLTKYAILIAEVSDGTESLQLVFGAPGRSLPRVRTLAARVSASADRFARRRGRPAGGGLSGRVGARSAAQRAQRGAASLAVWRGAAQAGGRVSALGTPSSRPTGRPRREGGGSGGAGSRTGGAAPGGAERTARSAPAFAASAAGGCAPALCAWTQRYRDRRRRGQRRRGGAHLDLARAQALAHVLRGSLERTRQRWHTMSIHSLLPSRPRQRSAI